MNPANLRLVDVSRTAENFLQKYNPSGKLPVPIEEIVELRMGIAVVVVPGIKHLLGIDAFINSDFSQITIDEHSYTAYPERTKFSIAHEVGHLVLHADWYKTHGPKTIDDHLTFYDRIDHEIYKYLEIQASTFAGLILVPRRVLLEKLQAKLGRTPSNESLELMIPVFQDLLEVFQVSGEVLLRRMQREKVVRATSRGF